MELSIKTLFIFALGFFSQVLFFARTIVQWIKSEKAGKILSPVLFWQISLIASIIMLIYGILRKDFAIILGQLITFFIYIRNLQLQHAWKKIPFYFRFFSLAMPFVCLGWTAFSGNYSMQHFFKNEEIAPWLFVFGIAAQIIFTFRFVYQWLVSERKKLSALPPGFWYISLTGSLLIFTYALFRRDPVLLLGHMGGMIMYLRNLMLHYTGKGLFDLLPFDLGVVKKFTVKKKSKRNK
ncbi:lipid-A-disaccharide synthase N-terminal domain-containing protein [Roseimarinus sediminis]|uniref:lipid-A-disaccharide synthase N-terminal domain-containing protein n=1 Tax=Roseimarinus sediminis TaxID=1610899 RepID=UPI003D1BFA97